MYNESIQKKDIYKLTNDINNKIYIGQAKDYKERWLKHVYEANNNNKKRKKTVIDRAIKKIWGRTFPFRTFGKTNRKF